MEEEPEQQSQEQPLPEPDPWLPFAPRKGLRGRRRDPLVEPRVEGEDPGERDPSPEE